MRLNACPNVRTTVTAMPANTPPRVRLAIAGLAWTLDVDEALALADRLVDAVEAIRSNTPTERTPTDDRPKKRSTRERN